MYYCQSDAETIEHAKAQHCIAREMPVGSELPQMYLGIVRVPVEYTADQERALSWRNRERGIDDAIKNADSVRACPECGYPAPPWRLDCRVCGFKMGRVALDASSDQ